MSFPAPPPIGLETMGEVHDVVVPGTPVGGQLAEAERAAEPLARPPATSAAASERASLAGCALLGLAAGHRSMAPLAVLALARPRPRRGVALPAAVAMLAAVELVVDKLPFVPPRTRAFPAVVRALSGALAGAVAAHRARRWAVGGAVIGGAAAVAATELGLRLRLAAEDSMPPMLAALVEDVLAVSMAFGGASLARAVEEPTERVRHGMSQGRESIDVRVSG